MKVIPLNIRGYLSKDPFMKVCIRHSSDCDLRIEWEHAWIYAGKQIQEVWAIVPCCTYHHRGAGLNKEYNQLISLLRASEMGVLPFIIAKYPKIEWIQKYRYLVNKKYER